MAGFLWISQDPTSGSARPGTTSSEIRRHVALVTRARWLSHRKHKIWDETASATKIAREGWRKEEPKVAIKPIETHSTVSRMSLSSKKSDDGCLRVAPWEVQLTSCVFAEGNSFDPFGRTPIKLTKEMHGVLQYFLAFSIMTSYRGKPLVKGHPSERHRHCVNTEILLRESLSSETLLYALLASTSARMAQVQVNQKYREKQTNAFMSQAIRKLREQLAQPDSISTSDAMKTVFQLSIGEWYRENYNALRTHLNVQERLIEGRYPCYSLTALDHFRMEYICFYNIFMAAEMGSKPSFPVTWQPVRLTKNKRKELNIRLKSLSIDAKRRSESTTPKSNYSMTAEDTIEGRSSLFALAIAHPAEFANRARNLWIGDASSHIPSGLIEVADGGFLSGPFEALIRNEIVPWTDIVLLCSVAGDITADETELMLETGAAILHKLLNLDAAYTTTSGCRGEAARLTLVMVISELTCPMTWRLVPRNLLRVKSAFEAMETFHTAFEDTYRPSLTEAELTLWILTVCFSATVDADHEWFASRAVRLALLLGVHTSDQMHRLMWRFFHRCMMNEACIENLMSRIADAGALYEHIRQNNIAQDRR